MNKKLNISLAIIIALFIALIASTATYAVWIQKSGEAKFLEFNTIDENPSTKYQIFVPVNTLGERIEGTMNVIGREYTLTNPSDISEVSAYALVGWDGGIAVYRLEVPDEYTMKIDGTDQTKPVSSVLVDEDFSDYLFSGNTIITEIEISQSVTHIDAGAFSFMDDLTTLILAGTGDIAIGDYAFASCPELSTINTGYRTIIGNEELIFFRS